MKKVSISNFLFLLLICTSSWASSYAEIEVRDLEDFTKLSVATGIDLTMSQGNENSAEITVDNIDLDQIVTKVEGNKLVVKVKGWNLDFGKKKKVKIIVALTYKELKHVSASSGASIVGQNNLSNDVLFIAASSGSEIDLQIEADQVATKASTGSEIMLSGECNSFQGSVSTGSEIEASDLESSIAEVKANTGSEINIWVTESLFAKANTGGEVRYKGNPEEIKKKKGTGGNVRKI